MRPSLMLDRPTPMPMAATRRAVVGRFRLAHAGIALIHLTQAILVLGVAGDVALRVVRGADDASEVLATVSVGTVLAVYFGVAALYHGLAGTVLRAFYESDLRQGRNRMRWAEYAVGAPLLMMVIALSTGVTWVVSLAVVGAATIVMVVCGWMQEALNPPGRRATTMVPFWAGVAASILPWVVVAAQIVHGETAPAIGLSVFLALFLLWAAFGVNQWLQYHQVGPWADWLYGERTFVVLSLVAKSALAWQVVVGASQG